MRAHVTDSLIFRDFYSTEEMRSIFDDRQLIQYWLDVEAALARAEAHLGIVPEAAAVEIGQHARVENIDMEALREGTNLVGYPILPLVRQLSALSGASGAYVHWGATTQDIMDTAVVLQLRAALQVMERDLEKLLGLLRQLAEEQRFTVMAGRTHGQHALPITFGYKVAVWVDELERHAERLREARPRILRCQFAGAAGTLASLGSKGWQVHQALADELQLKPSSIAWHSARDNLGEYVSLCGLLTATQGKIAHEVAMLQKTELAEVEEPFVSGKGSSSTMPQKRNPILCETVIGISQLVSSQVPAMLGAMRPEHERAMGEWHVEWDLLPHVSQLTAAALRHSIGIFDGLVVHPARMRRNLQLTDGLILAEAVMMRLSPEIGRQVAHDKVYEACAVALESNRSLLDVLACDPKIAEHLSQKELNELLDPQNYVGLAPFYVDQVVKRASSGDT